MRTVRARQAARRPKYAAARAGEGAELQTAVHMPVQRYAQKGGTGSEPMVSSGATRPGMRRAKCAARCPKTETVGISGQCARPAARLPAGFKQGNVGVPRQGDGGGQSCPACADDGDFRARMRRVHHLFLQWLKPRPGRRESGLPDGRAVCALCPFRRAGARFESE